MSFITLARELGSISAEQVIQLSVALGMDCIDKEFVEKRFDEIGVTRESLREFDEKKPGFFARLFRGEPDHYLETLRIILFYEAQHGRKLIVGRGGNFIFADTPNCLRVRLTASPEIRIRNIMQWEGCTEAKARSMMDKSDSDRAGFCIFHYNEDWYSANNYDVVVKTDNLPNERLVRFLKGALESIMTPEREQKGQKLLNDRALARTISLRIWVDECLPVRFLVVECDDGKAVLKGLAMSRTVSDRAEEITRSVEGVVSVDNQLKVVKHSIPKRIE